MEHSEYVEAGWVGLGQRAGLAAGLFALALALATAHPWGALFASRLPGVWLAAVLLWTLGIGRRRSPSLRRSLASGLAAGFAPILLLLGWLGWELTMEALRPGPSEPMGPAAAPLLGLVALAGPEVVSVGIGGAIGVLVWWVERGAARARAIQPDVLPVGEARVGASAPTPGSGRTAA